MAFVVEDGTGKSDANSYTTVAEFRAYWLDRGIDYSGTNDTIIETYLVRATQYAEGAYRFKGIQAHEDQALHFPAYESGYSNNTLIYDSRMNIYIEADEIPISLKNGIFELGRAAESTTVLAGEQTNLSSRRVGPLSVTFSDKGLNMPDYREANRYLSGLIEPMGIVRV